MILLFLLAAADEVPLVLPKVQPTVQSEKRAFRHLIEERSIKDRPLHAGLKMLGIVQSGDLVGGPVGALELGYRLPILQRRLGLMIEPAFGGLYGNTVSSLWLSLPLGVTWHEPLGPGLLRAYVAASADWLATRATTAGETFSDRSWNLGGTAGVGYAWELGPGALVVEARYRLMPYVVAARRVMGHGATFSLGYSFFFL